MVFELIFSLIFPLISFPVWACYGILKAVGGGCYWRACFHLNIHMLNMHASASTDIQVTKQNIDVTKKHFLSYII